MDAATTTLGIHERRDGRVPCSALLAVNGNDSQKEIIHELHLFAGGGGGILGGILLGHEPVCAVELEPYARQILLQRQRDGLLPAFPIWDDVTTFDGTPWRGIVDAVCGGFPCQDISCANANGKGLDGERSGLWGEMRRVIGEIRPRYVFVENSPMLTIRGLGRVLGDLAALGYDAAWGVLGACDVGAPHKRERIWILADAARPASQGSRRGPHGQGCSRLPRELGRGDWWANEPGLARMANGVACPWVDRIKASGNGQVPAVAAFAWQTLDALLTANDQGDSQSPAKKL